MSYHVYFMKTNIAGPFSSRPIHAYKIGYAADVFSRMAQVQTGCPSELLLVGVLRCRSKKHAAYVEKDLHEYFADRRMCGEWFRLSANMAWQIRFLVEEWSGQLTLVGTLHQLEEKAKAFVKTRYRVGAKVWDGLGPELTRKELIARVKSEIEGSKQLLN